MKRFTLLFLLFLPFLSKAQTNRFGFPIDKTGRVAYDSIVKFEGLSKQLLFKRVQEFIASQDFDRAMNIKCEDGNSITTKFYEKSIRYADAEDGKILGSGFLPFIYKDYKYIFTVFDYKVQVKDNACKYEFSNFRVLEFKKAPKNKSRGGAAAGTGYVFAGTSTSFSSSTIAQSTMEDFMERLRKWYRKEGRTDQFTGNIDKLITSLQTTLVDTF